MRNALRKFDAVVEAQLGIYVYALRDPSSRRIFYVGKGGGNGTTPGNSRVFSHFDEADNSINSSESSKKIATIRSIWESGNDVDWFIVRHRLRDDAEAFSVEAAIIDTLRITNQDAPDNDQAGHNSTTCGLKGPIEIAAMSAPPVNPRTSVTVLAVNVGKSLGVRPTEKDLLECTKGAWALGKFALKDSVNYVVAIQDGISLAAYQVDPKCWKCEKVKATKNEMTRWSFMPLGSSGHPDLVGKNWGFVRAAVGGSANYNPAWIIKFDGEGDFQVLKPTKSKHFKCQSGLAVSI